MSGSRYATLNPVGEGCFGTVRRALDLRTGRYVAVKQVPLVRNGHCRKEAVQREVDGLRLVREARHVVRLHDSYEHAGCACLVLDLLPGADLYRRFTSFPGERMEPAFALSVARQMLEALADCHALRLVVGDVKPHNTMLHGATATLVDFGACSPLGPDGMVRVPRGTPAYAAPEVGRRRYGTPADVYSAGAVLHQLLTGLSPAPIALDALADQMAPEVAELLRGLLCAAAGGRLTAEEALAHPALVATSSAPRGPGPGSP